MKFQAVNNTIILLKDKGDNVLDIPVNEMREIPEPFTGTIDTVGLENEWKPGDRIVFDGIGGVYLRIEDKEYVVITPEMIIGKLC